jgi:hypothetical protein
VCCCHLWGSPDALAIVFDQNVWGVSLNDILVVLVLTAEQESPIWKTILFENLFDVIDFRRVGSRSQI